MMPSSLPPSSCKIYTPKPLATAMIRAVLAGDVSAWLEPSVGRGVFLTALAEHGVPKNNVRGIDLDPVPEPADERGRIERGVDFITWANDTNERFCRIVGNPPYLPILTLPAKSRKAASSMLLPGTRKSLSARANLWSAFVCGSVHLLARGGAMSFVLPAAWDYADYAAPLRAHLPRLFSEFYVLRCRTPLFDDVQEGAVVIVARNFGGNPKLFHRRECATSLELISTLNEIGEQPKTEIFASRKSEQKLREHNILRDILEIRLGGVTGDAKYFLLTEPQRLNWGLPIGAVRPVLTKAHHLASAFITDKGWKKLCDAGERVWLFRPPNRLLGHSKVKAYLDLESDSGGCNRSALKIKMRDSWHQTPLPRTPDGFISGMTQSGPWLAFSSMQNLSATNTLYTFRFRERFSRLEQAGWALAFLSSPVRMQLEKSCRVYAAGLKKFEPGDLHALRIPTPAKVKDALDRYVQAVELILKRQMDKATVLADKALGL